MIEFVIKSSGVKKSFPFLVAENIMQTIIKLKKKGSDLDKYWSLPEDSNFVYIDGSLIEKPKEKVEKKKKEKEAQKER